MMSFPSTALIFSVIFAFSCKLHEVVAQRRNSFQCPPADSIYPCECSTHPIKVVKCDDVKNLEIVRNALENRFAKPLPKLQISNVHTFSLPHNAFRNISVRKLVLNGNNIRRIHDDAFDGQESLGLLILSDDRLTDFPSEALKRLTSLRTLSLADNFLMKVTEDSLKSLPNLSFLVLSDNRISQIQRNAFPRSLETLFLSRNHIKILNGSVNYLSKLEILYLKDNRLTTVKGELEGLTQLRHLALDGNKISDLKDSLSDLKSLRSLSLAYNNLETIGEELHHLTELQHLNLSYNYITELNEELFQNLNRIEILDLSGNYFRTVCATISPLTGLRELNLSDTSLKTLDHDCFRGMRSLTSLDVSYNELKNIDAITVHHFPKMLFLYLHHNQLLSLKHGLKNLNNLYELDISDNQMSSIKYHHLMHNKMLSVLKIAGNPWECSDSFTHLLRDLETRRVNIIGNEMCYLSENTL